MLKISKRMNIGAFVDSSTAGMIFDYMGSCSQKGYDILKKLAIQNNDILAICQDWKYVSRPQDSESQGLCCIS
jgi:hypothetical protein